MGVSRVLTGISLVTANDNKNSAGQNYRIVTNFKLYGCATNSENEADWALVLDVTETGMDSRNYAEYYYAIADAEAYQYYKIVFGDTNMYQFSELWIYSSVPTKAEVQTISGPNPGGGEGYEKMFDGILNSKFCSGDRTPIIVKLDGAKTLTGISLVSGNDSDKCTGRMVKGFTLYGSATNSQTDSDWTEVIKVDQTGMGNVNFTEYCFDITGASAYEYYKLVFHDTNMVQLSEVMLYCK